MFILDRKKDNGSCSGRPSNIFPRGGGGGPRDVRRQHGHDCRDGRRGGRASRMTNGGPRPSTAVGRDAGSATATQAGGNDPTC